MLSGHIHGVTDVRAFNNNNNMGIKKITERKGCCISHHTRNCFLAIGVVGCLSIIVGLLIFTMGPSFLSSMIQQSLALSPDSERLASWLVPPVEAHLTAYAFNLTNPEEVMLGGKPVVEEVGPFVYKAVTVKDSRDVESGQPNLNFDFTGSTITYRPRKFYFLVSGDPDNTFITIPNIPLLTALSSIRGDSPGFAKSTKEGIMIGKGLGKIFINVSFSGLLWGYDDELPCFNLPRPDGCPSPPGEIDIFSEDWEDYDWKRKRSADDDGLIGKTSINDNLNLTRVKRFSPDIDLRSLNFSLLDQPKADYVGADCRCEWGLFRDRNVTLRKPVTIHHGMKNLNMKGWVEKFDNSTTLGWWEKGSHCDKVGGQDGPTLPPMMSHLGEIDLFIGLMCRKINLQFEKITSHSNLSSKRFIPPPNSFGSHKDTNLTLQNMANSCYCQESKGFSCLKSGVLNMEPCKATTALPKGAPIALSFPHFYQADPAYLEAVSGLSPDKTQHQFYVDIEPTLGFPLAIRPRFQLNAIIRKDKDIEIMRKFPEELVLPFLWAQDGFSEPSPSMASAIQFGLSAPHRLPLFGGVGLLVLGGALLLVSLGWWTCSTGIQTHNVEIPLN